MRGGVLQYFSPAVSAIHSDRADARNWVESVYTVISNTVHTALTYSISRPSSKDTAHHGRSGRCHRCAVSSLMLFAAQLNRLMVDIAVGKVE